MFNLRLSIIVGVVAFVLSFVIGLVSHAHIGYVVLRAAIFMVVFFALGSVVWALIGHFIPELLSTDDGRQDAHGTTGSQVNITVEGNSDFAIPGMYGNSTEPDSIGGIFSDSVVEKNETASRGMDQNREDGYTLNEEGGLDSQNQQEEPELEIDPDIDGPLTLPAGFVPSFGDGAGDLGGLPDLDAMAGAFSADGPVEDVDSTIPERTPTGNKAQPLKGDFDPQELAQGIRTVLSKDKK